MSIINLDEYRPHRVGIVCCPCGRWWIGIVMESWNGAMECPHCGRHKARFADDMVVTNAKDLEERDPA